MPHKWLYDLNVLGSSAIVAQCGRLGAFSLSKWERTYTAGSIKNMRASPRLLHEWSIRSTLSSEGIGVYRYQTSVPIIKIEDGSFYRRHPNTQDPISEAINQPLFSHLTFSLPSTPLKFDKHNSTTHASIQQHWAVIGEVGKTDFLNVLRGRHISVPPTARSYPYLSSKTVRKKDHRLVIPDRGIQYLGFDGEQRSPSPFGGLQGAYLSARYESRREETDWTVLQYLRGETELNPAEKIESETPTTPALLEEVVRSLHLEKLKSMPVSSLSNGQKRRARVAKALLSQPEVLLLDEPFMGLDPPTQVTLSTVLRKLAHNSSPRFILSLRPQDPIPEWITHLIFIGSDNKVALQGPIYSVLLALKFWATPINNFAAISKANELTKIYGRPPTGLGNILTHRGITRDNFLSECDFVLRSRDERMISSFFTKHLSKSYKTYKSPSQISRNHAVNLIGWHGLRCTPESAFTLGLFLKPGLQPFGNLRIIRFSPAPETDSMVKSPLTEPPLIELKNVVVKYGTKVVLGGPKNGLLDQQGFNLDIRGGTRLAVIGPNGSGKTTLLSLLTSDHPQSYSLPIKFFGRSRLPSLANPGMSLWDIQSHIGHSSPEIHAFFPRHLTIRQTLESAFSETFLGKPSLSEDVDRDIDAIITWFAPELDLNYESAQDSAEPKSLAWATTKATAFGNLNFHQQRLLLFLRAIVKKPKIVILDEAFSGFPLRLRERVMCFLESGENEIPHLLNRSSDAEDQTATSRHRKPNTGVRTAASSHQQNKVLPTEEAVDSDYRFTGLRKDQALVVVSHVKEEIPICVTEWLRLPGEAEIENGKVVERGTCEQGGLRTDRIWNEIWDS